MNSLANYLTKYLIENNIVEAERKEEYVYGIQSLLGKVVNYTTLLLIAMWSEVLIPGIIFMIVFFSLRERTGGYHAKTPIWCYMGTIISFLLIIHIAVPLIQGNVFIYITITIVSGTVTFIFAPVNHPNLLLDSEEIDVCQQASRWLFILITGCIWIAYALHVKQICITYAIMGLGLDAALILIAKMIGQEVKGNEKKSREENCIRSIAESSRDGN